MKFARAPPEPSAADPFLSESSLRCPGCGAPAVAECARCDYCGAALATVTCPSCFAPMFAGSRFCARCGAEATRTMVDDEKPLTCPRCAESLQSLQLGTTMVRECAACGGLWIDPGTLQKLCDAREEHAGVVSALAVRMPKNTAPTDTVRYIPCPQCAKLMNRVNFAHSSGVIMDVCKTDGVWLDRGELQRVMGFVEQGGMAVERERQRQQLADERWRLEQAKATSAAMLRDTGGITISTTRHISPSSTAVEHLLLDALGLFIK